MVLAMRLITHFFHKMYGLGCGQNIYIKPKVQTVITSVLDFIFVANTQPNWEFDSRIILDEYPIRDDNKISDHRAIEARFLIHSE